MKKDQIKNQLEEIKSLLRKKDDQLLNFKQAADYLSFSHSYLYKLTSRKIIPHYKPTGKMLFFSKAELEEWIFNKEQNKSPHPSPLPKEGLSSSPFPKGRGEESKKVVNEERQGNKG